MHFSKITSKLHFLIDKYNERMVSKLDFVSQFLNHPFLDGSGRIVKILMI